MGARGPMKDKHKAALRAAGLMNRLESFATATPPDPAMEAVDPIGYAAELKKYNKTQITPGHVQAIQILLKKLVPDLTSVEQTVVDERDQLTEEQIFERMAAVVKGSPDLARRLREMLTPTAVPALTTVPTLTVEQALSLTPEKRTG